MDSFFGREKEIALLRRERETARRAARFTVLTGRRRVGKTALVRKALDDGVLPYVHLPITRQPESTLCGQMQEEAERALGMPIPGSCRRFGELFDALMRESVRRPFTLVLDEFQEFDRTNPGVFGDVQAVWDRYHATSRINLVVSGSVNRLMEKIFFRDSEPLYGRNTGKLVLKPFEPALLKTVFRHYRPRFAPDALLALWTVSGGVARYVDMMMSSRAFTRKAMLASIFSETSPYADEGRTVLADEFGSDYGTYFTILSAVASGKTTSAELKNLLGTDVGGFLGKLEKQYGIVSRKQPLFDRDAAKNGHWQIDDCFFRFWFRFVFKYRYLVELGRYDRLLDIATRDFDTFSGPALERYFRWKFECEGLYTRMGGWWDRKGENEIDLVCEDETRNVLDFYEIKRDPSRIDLRTLAHKRDAFLVKNPDKRDRRISLNAISIDDM
jgi:AAA+ ATPase superfamily predicted ATPase